MVTAWEDAPTTPIPVERMAEMVLEAIGAADVKIIANSGDVQGGVASVGDLFTARGGTNLTGMLEAIAQGDIGKGLIEKVAGAIDSAKSKPTPRNGSVKQ